MNKHTHKNQSGFTIVELLIVVVVIAILAAITIVSYGNIQKKARDTKRIDDVSKIAKGIQLWSVGTGGSFATMSAGSGGNEIGWIDTQYSYASVKEVLVSSGYMSDGVVDPINNKSAGQFYAYMITTCNQATEPEVRVILARLENPPAQTIAQQIGSTCTDGTFTSYTTTYLMNYAKVIDLSS